MDGHAVLVTGAASGIGAGIARACAQAGAAVAIVDRDADGAERVADEIVAAAGRAVPVRADVTRPEDVTAAVDATVAAFGSLSGLVNNAGILLEGSVLELADADWDRIMAVNLTAPFLLTRAAVPHMLERGGGAIVNIASIEGLAAGPRHVGYSVTKAGLVNLTRATAIDLGRQGIRANAICPGSVETPLYEAFLAGHEDPDEVRQQLIDRNFANRLGRPADIGAAAVFLLSDDASFVNGTTLVVDGGRMAKVS
jgi:NAD(P)-dependent dehydrogenase (short-subunit alcohol dehydrogenase family)